MCEYLSLSLGVCHFIGLESVCVRPPGGHSLSRRCNPTPAAKPHPIQPLVSRRKSQTLTLTLRTSCGVAIGICIDRKDGCACGNWSKRDFRGGDQWCCRLQQRSRLRLAHCLNFKRLKVSEEELGRQRGRTGEMQVNATRTQCLEVNIVKV